MDLNKSANLSHNLDAEAICLLGIFRGELRHEDFEENDFFGPAYRKLFIHLLPVIKSIPEPDDEKRIEALLFELQKAEVLTFCGRETFVRELFCMYKDMQIDYPTYTLTLKEKAEIRKQAGQVTDLNPSFSKGNPYIEAQDIPLAIHKAADKIVAAIKGK